MHEQTLTIVNADNASVENVGLRSFLAHRQSGVVNATGNTYAAHVTNGRVAFEDEGYGKAMLRAGSSVMRPPGIVHREGRHSDDMELLEITSPATFETRPAKESQ